MINPEILSNILTYIMNILGYIAPVANAIVVFMLPMLEPMGNALRNFIVLVLDQITVGNYTWFIVVTAVTTVVAIGLAIIFPGEKEES